MIIIKNDIYGQPYARLELKKAMGIKYLLNNGYSQCNNENYYQKGEIYFSYNRYMKCWISDSYCKNI